MKNIHVIPTDKPSRLVKQKYDTIDRLCLADMATKRAEYKRFNIYITSDDEIKEGDWYVNTLDEVVRKNNTINHSYHKKIILTTDQDLIADGVEQISEKYLLEIIKDLNNV